jgi:uncharacterized protein (DUF58 family)
MRAFWKAIYVTDRFYIVFLFIAATSAIGYALPFLFYLAVAAFIVAFMLTLWDAIRLFSLKDALDIKRIIPEILSLGDNEEIEISMRNPYAEDVHVSIIEDLPYQLKIRNFQKDEHLKARQSSTVKYTISPKIRGEYRFGNTILLIETRVGRIKRRMEVENTQMVKVYPSIRQMKEMEMLAFTKVHASFGLKKIRRIGHSYEFEQIKPYVQGDDYRSINWKATSRTASLMMNQYEDEKSQSIINIIDCGRRMHMPFNGMTLVDYAVNSALALSNVVLKKYDKVGLVTFAEKTHTFLPADVGKFQMRRVLDTLYNQEVRQAESDYEILYKTLSDNLTTRSFIVLYSNFENISSVRRIYPILKKLNQKHLLMMVVFKNTELEDFVLEKPETIREAYLHTVARSAMYDKTQIIQTLRQIGIQVTYVEPEGLSLGVINKYLELKSRGLI